MRNYFFIQRLVGIILTLAAVLYAINGNGVGKCFICIMCLFFGFALILSGDPVFE